MEQRLNQHRRQQSESKAFTLLEMIVVLLVLGLLAAISVPTYTTVKTNSIDRSVNTTLDAIARAGEAAYISDPQMSDAEVAEAAIEGLDADDDPATPGYQSGDRTIELDGVGGVDVILESGSISRDGGVVFTDGVATVTHSGSGGGGGPSSTAPGAPLITSLTPGGGTLSVAFAAPGSDGGAPISNYQYALDGGLWVSAGTAASPFTIPGLTNGTSYVVTLRAVNAVGPGAASTGVSGTPAPTWSLLGGDIDGEAASDQSGSSTAISSDGTVLAVGAGYNDGVGSNAGHVRVYTWNGTSWSQRGGDIDGEAAGDRSGEKIALNGDGTIVAIGAMFNYGAASNAGHVRVYAWNGTSWVQRGGDIDGEAETDYSGTSVALSNSGTTLAVGATYNDGNGANSGHVRVYSWNGTSWTQQGGDIDGEAAGDESGSAVSLSSNGSIVAVGARANNSWTGHVRVYAWDGNSWSQRGSDINGEAFDDELGYAVDLSADGNVLAAGGYGNDGAYGNLSYSGYARVYSWNGTSWVQRGGDFDAEASGDYYGIAVSLDSAGAVVAIGGKSNDGNGANSGHVRVYSWNGTSWGQRGGDIDGEAAGDLSGSAVALSGDSNTIAIGAPENDGTGGNAGHVRVYAWD